MRKDPAKMQIMNRYELQQFVESKPRNIQILISLLYLTGCRISELCEIKKKQVVFEERYNKDFLLFYNVPCLKRVKRRKKIEGEYIPINEDKQVPLRTVMVLVEKEKYFIDLLQPYLARLGPEAKLFSMHRTRAWQLLNPYGLFPHYFRHLRITHLIQHYGWGSYELKTFTGWASGQMGDTYVHLSGEFLIKKLAGQQ